MILAYRVFTTILYPILILLIYIRKILKKEDPKRFKEKIFVSNFRVAKKKIPNLIWFHAASIGEFKSIIPIINQLIINNPNLKFLITTSTLSSGNLAKSELKNFDNIEHRYFPLDVKFLISKFLYLWQPDRIFLVDSEIWPNLLLEAKKLKIPIALINARLTSRSFKKWMLFPNTAKKIFNIFDLFICSNNETKKFLKKLNIKNVYFKGNIKLISQINEKKIKNKNKDILLKKRFWLAASTHYGEDILCLKTHLSLKEKYKNILTVIAPRHIERVEGIKSMCTKFNLKTQILNKDEIILKNKEIIIVNHFGVLQNYYKYAKSVFIGKSMIEKLKDDGGQNPIEAAILKCKIYHGPYVSNFEELYNMLDKYNIAKQVTNYNELSKNLIKDLNSQSKINNSMSKPIKILGQKTFIDTMKLVDNFLINDNQ